VFFSLSKAVSLAITLREDVEGGKARLKEASPVLPSREGGQTD